MAATIGSNVSEAKDPARNMLVRNTVEVLRALMECSDEIQHGVMEMAQIVADPNASEDEKAAAADTLIEALYPEYVGKELGIDATDYEALQRKEIEPRAEEQLDQEEATFADNLSKLLARKQMTQKELADAIGVGQPAISMMLTRSCRPQRRTVEKIANALGVTVADLWPGP